jgi:hypothetical protein
MAPIDDLPRSAANLQAAMLRPDFCQELLRERMDVEE